MSNNGPIVILVAMESERMHLDPLIQGMERHDSDIWPTWRASINGQDVITIMCGIGMVSAAAATEHAITAWQPSVLLNFGCTGAHSREIFPGDVVIGTDLIHQGRMRFAPDGDIIPLDIPFTVPGEIQPRAGLTCDPTLVETAQEAARDISLPLWPEQFRLEVQPADRAPAIKAGPIASADVWLQDPVRLDAMHTRTGSLCEDMEAAAIGQIATLHGLPFLSIKDISNSEFFVVSVFEGSSSELPKGELGKRAAMLLVATIERLTAS